MTSPLGEYLRARRALVSPEDVGLPRDPNRRVAGLRRDEVARVAAISPEYYLRLEQGHHQTPSEPVLQGLARALLLDDAAESYMRRLVAHTDPEAAELERSETLSGEQIRALLDAWPHLPAGMLDRNMDVVATNRMLDIVTRGTVAVGDNVVQFIFSEGFKRIAFDWERLAAGTVAGLRYAGDPTDPRYRQIVGDLLVRSREFRHFWLRHDASPWSVGRTTHDIPPLGPVEMTFQNFEVSGTGGYHLSILFPDPGSEGADLIAELAERARDPEFRLPDLDLDASA
ncbi:helix-turn-helix transcriptional regulator [Microbacterium timonense]|uniref:helix-turn-helix transcriptional regulator n=1 Tax=Microbacterium timonense TaxID=2086576 RepID=UPI00135CC3DD|nr:helix-turn-helix transcriptional regulator [Microbacterium timonense]